MKFFLILNTVTVPQYIAKWNTCFHTHAHRHTNQDDLVTQSYRRHKKSAFLTSHQDVCFLFSSRSLMCVCVCMSVLLTDSENSYTLSCGVPVQPGKAPQKRNATTALPTCAGTVGQAWWNVLRARFTSCIKKLALHRCELWYSLRLQSKRGEKHTLQVLVNSTNLHGMQVAS